MRRKSGRAAVLASWESRYGPEAPVTGRARRRAPALALPPARAWLRSGPRLVSTVALIALVTAAAHLGFSSRYVVFAPVVVGNTRVSAERIRAAAGLDGGRLFRIDRSAAEERVAALPEIRAARVHARLPHDVWITVEETEAVLVWESPSAAGTVASILLVDERGLVVAAGEPGGLPRVIDEAGLLREPGDRLPAEVLAAALAYGARFANLHYRAAGGFVAESDRGWDVLLGTDATMADRQAALLASIEAHLAAQDAVAVVDLRFERPYYRLNGFGRG
jgi:hypothetical protein